MSLPENPSLANALRVWLRVAVLSFGGPTSQIAVMHRIIVDEKKWISEHRFLHALNYCMLLPGPEAQQLATYLGWLMHGIRGGILAGTLFVIPGFFSILALSFLYVLGKDTAIIVGIFFGLKPAVVAIVAEAVQRIAKRVLSNRVLVSIAFLAFVAIFFFHVPFPIIVGSAAALGLVGQRFAPKLVVARSGHAAKSAEQLSSDEDRVGDRLVQARRVSIRQSLVLATICLVLWWGPLAGLAAVLGGNNTLVKQGVFFSKVAVATFGGAYSVLSYVQQEAVDKHHWVTAEEMIDGLGMAETTPGPLIQVVQFVGFLGAYRDPGLSNTTLSPLEAGLAASVITTWVTYLPCFLWIFLGAPYIEQLRGNVKLNAALTAVTAAVVGVVLNLAVTFALHVFFRDVTSENWYMIHWLQPVWRSFDIPAAALTIFAFVMIFLARRGILLTLIICAAIGAVLQIMKVGPSIGQ